MAGDWIKMRADLLVHIKVLRIADGLSCSPAEVLVDLYRLAGWFATHGKYGKLAVDRKSLDRYIGRPGFAEQLILAGWLVDHVDTMTIHQFCDVSTWRKSLGRKVREQVLSAGRCAKCSSTEQLVIDHKTPIVRGGSCEIENLQVLCAPCNRKKGRKTMEEFSS